MDWKEEYGKKLMTADEAVKEIRSGDYIILGLGALVPYGLCQALGRRKDELRDVIIVESVLAKPVPWLEPGYEKAFNVEVRLFTVLDRHLENQGRADALSLATSLMPKQWEEEDRKKKRRTVHMTRVSEPNEQGYCSFGEMIWWSKSLSQSCDLVLAEVTPGLIRTYGDNYIHVSEIDKLAEYVSPPGGEEGLKKVGMVTASGEEARIAEIIGATVAGELIKDEDVIQFGGGTVSGAMAAFLGNKHDLGVHSEVIPGGVPTLVKEGVITGRRKNIHTGKVTGTCFGGLSVEEMAFVNNNPLFELYDITYINNPKLISSYDNMVAINNALVVDLTGEIASDSLGPKMYTGAGGQLDFVVGALLSKGGRSIHVLPSTGAKGSQSRIVSMLAQGQGTTVPRAFADYVVTEYGVASLLGKSRKERVNELIAIAHPDFRGELREAAKKLSWI